MATRGLCGAGLGSSAGHNDGATGDDHERAGDLVEAVGTVAPEES